MSILDPCGSVLDGMPSAKVFADSMELVIDLNEPTCKALASLARGGGSDLVP
jgi:hypothetical protein